MVGPVIRAFDPPETPFGAGHRGIDIAVPVGTVVVAPEAGVVTFAGRVGGELFVTLDHGEGLTSTYSWVSVTLVRTGDVVARGAPIAQSGTGHPGSSLPHLHLGVRLDGAYLDPLEFLGPASVSDFIRLAPLTSERGGAAMSGDGELRPALAPGAPPDRMCGLPTRKAPLSPNAPRRFAVALAAGTVASVLVVAAASAQQVAPEWPQFQGGPGHPGALADGPAPPYRVRWTLPAPEGPALSGAVIFDGEAIALGEAAVYGVDLATGEIAWQVPRSGVRSRSRRSSRGPGVSRRCCSTSRVRTRRAGSGAGTPSPSVTDAPSGSTTPTEDEPGSELVAIELDGHTELWRSPLGASSRTGVAVLDDTAYVGDEDGVVSAVALADGSVSWTKDLREADGPCVGLSGGKVDVPIAVADGRVIAVARNVESASIAVSALDAADGTCLWQKSPQIGSSAASAAAAGEGSVFIGLADRLVRSIGGSDGEQAWGALALSVFSPVTSPALDGDALYVVDLGGGLYRFDVQDGKRLWSYQLNEVDVRSSPVVSGRAVLVGLRDGRMVAIDAASGHLVWQSEASPGLIGAIALAPDAVVAVKGGRDAGLVAFEHDPDAALVDVPPPTELEPGTLTARAAAAAAIVLAVVLVPGFLARRRFGAAFPEPQEPESGEPDEGEDET